MQEFSPEIGSTSEKLIQNEKLEKEEIASSQSSEVFDKTAPLTPEQQKFVAQGHELLLKIANKMFVAKTQDGNFQFEYRDFVSWGTDGLIEAAKKFDPSLGNQFSTYATPLIRGRILDQLRLEGFLDRRYIEFWRDYRKAVESLTAELNNREPTEKEIAEKMKLTPKQFSKRLKKYPREAGLVHIDGKNEGFHEGDSYLDYLIQKDNPHAQESSAEDNYTVMLELIDQALRELHLEKNEREVVDLYFFKEKKLLEIGEILGVTETRIYQIKKIVIEKLRKYFIKKGYRVPNISK